MGWSKRTQLSRFISAHNNFGSMKKLNAVFQSPAFPGLNNQGLLLLFQSNILKCFILTLKNRLRSLSAWSWNPVFLKKQHLFSICENGAGKFHWKALQHKKPMQCSPQGSLGKRISQWISCPGPCFHIYPIAHSAALNFTSTCSRVRITSCIANALSQYNINSYIWSSA